MHTEHLIIPIVALIIGVISLFTDPKKRKWISLLLSLLVVSCGLEVYFKTTNQRKAEKEIAWNRKWMEELIKNLNSFRSEVAQGFDKVDSLLGSFGYLKERIPGVTVTEVEQSFKANKERVLMASRLPSARAREITVEYFPKDFDPEVVRDALQELGFRLVVRQAILPDIPTNSIWFGSLVSIEDVKLVAYTLIRAGVKIKAIRPFRTRPAERASLIQVGGDALLVDAPALTVEEIRAATEFTRDE